MRYIASIIRSLVLILMGIINQKHRMWYFKWKSSGWINNMDFRNLDLEKAEK